MSCEFQYLIMRLFFIAILQFLPSIGIGHEILENIEYCWYQFLFFFFQRGTETLFRGSNQALSVVNLSSFTDTDTIMLLLSLIPYWFLISELPLYYLPYRKMKILHFGLCVFLVVKPSFLLNIIGKDDYFRNIIFWKIAISYKSCINVSTPN